MISPLTPPTTLLFYFHLVIWKNYRTQIAFPSSLAPATISIQEASCAFRKHVILHKPVLAHYCPSLDILCFYDLSVADVAFCLHKNTHYLLYLDGMALNYVSLAKSELPFPNSFLYGFG